MFDRRPATAPSLPPIDQIAEQVILLRVREPDLPRGFRVPGYPVTPVLSILACGYILVSLHWYTWLAFGAWVGIALIFYFVWGRHHSALNEPPVESPAAGA